jgi:hypothetical protein
MHPKGIRSVLLVRDGADVPTQWQQDALLSGSLN